MEEYIGQNNLVEVKKLLDGGFVMTEDVEECLCSYTTTLDMISLFARDDLTFQTCSVLACALYEDAPDDICSKIFNHTKCSPGELEKFLMMTLWSHESGHDRDRRIIKFLLDHGVNVNYRDSRGFTPLLRNILEIPKHRGVNVIQLLCDYGANPNDITYSENIWQGGTELLNGLTVIPYSSSMFEYAELFLRSGLTKETFQLCKGKIYRCHVTDMNVHNVAMVNAKLLEEYLTAHFTPRIHA